MGPVRPGLTRYRRVVAAGFAAAGVGFGLLAVRPVTPVATPPPAPARRPGLDLPSNLAAVPVRIADAGSVRLLHPGDRVDVYATAGDPAGIGATTETARAVARAVPVLSVPPENPGEQGALVVLETARDQAAALTAVPATSRFAIVILGSVGG